MSEKLSIRINEHGVALIADKALTFMDKLGDDLLVRAQRLVPKDTFSLHDSLVKVTKVERKGVVVTRVGVDPSFAGYRDIPPIDYWRYVEDGTSRQAPQPFLLPALMQTRGITIL